MATVTSDMTREEVVEKMRAMVEKGMPQFDVLMTGSATKQIGTPSGTGGEIARMMEDWNKMVDGNEIANRDGTTTEKFSEVCITSAKNATNNLILRSAINMA